jgi:tRNA A37 threonylcarbamoyladenosine synthetase subunit TsaC/SUA5/YrdC
VDAILDGGAVPYAPTTIIEFSDEGPSIVRQGQGVADFLR